MLRLMAVIMCTLSVTILWADLTSGAERRRDPAMEPVEDVPGLPRVLLIGDSISIGYTVPTRQLLEGEANVHRPPTNCGPTTRGLEAIDSWLGSGRWDVIHFNWGLHDLKYIADDPAVLADPKASNSRQQVPLDQYAANLERLVERMKRTGATLIWATTTPVPEGSAGRVPGDDEKYNAAARSIMERHGVAVNDLYAFSKPRLAEIQLPANVHFTPAGYRALAGEVAAAIRKAIAERKP